MHGTRSRKIFRNIIRGNMLTHEKLLALAVWLEDQDNDILIDSETDENKLNVVAKVLVQASNLIKTAAEQVYKIENNAILNETSLEDMAALANILDESDDDFLKKQASVIDEILLTIGAQPGQIDRIKQAEEEKIQDVKKKLRHQALEQKYIDTHAQEGKRNQVVEAQKAITDSEFSKQYNPLEAPLSTRTCPDHPGAQVARVGEDAWQCTMDKKIYSYKEGFDLYNGKKVPGGDVAEQTPSENPEFYNAFDTRDQRLNNR
jgi:hypothetical protein